MIRGETFIYIYIYSANLYTDSIIKEYGKENFVVFNRETHKEVFEIIAASDGSFLFC